MAMRTEKWLDKHESAQPGEVRFNKQERDRMYRQSKGPAAVPVGDLREVSRDYDRERCRPIVSYTLRTAPSKRALSPVQILKDADVDKNINIIDARILGEEGERYDDVFSKLRTSAAAQRYERIHKKARRIRLGMGLAGAMIAGTTLGVLHGPVPEVRFVPLDDCSWIQGGEYIQRLTTQSLDISQNVENGTACTFEGQKYVIQEVPPPLKP